MKPTRAALYARCSTGHQDVGLQVDELRAVAAHRGLIPVHEYVDEGVSGATTSRPGFDAMMKAAQAGKFEHLLVWKLDRLGRSRPHLELIKVRVTAGVRRVAGSNSKSS